MQFIIPLPTGVMVMASEVTEFARALKEKGVKLWVLTSSAHFNPKLPFKV